MNYLLQINTQEMLELIVPELKELVTNWDALDQTKRGSIIGKYGVEIATEAL
jgi:hypothetical protein